MTAFDFITDEWLDLHTWLTQVRALPRTEMSFAERYGRLDDAADAQDTTSALLTAAELADRFGGATPVKREIARDGLYLTSEDPPAMLYGHLVWWAMQVQHAVSSATSQLASLTTMLDDGHATAADVRSVLAGPGGLSATLRTAARHGRDVSTGLANLRDHLLPQIEVIAGSSTVRVANRSIGQLETQLARLRERAAEDYRTWKHRTLAPGDSPPPIEVAAATPSGPSWPHFGRAKERAAEQDYAAALEAIAAAHADEAAKARYVAEVGGLDLSGVGVAPALHRLTGGIDAIATDLEQVAARAGSVAQDADDEQLTDPTWLGDALELDRIAGLDAAASAFIEGALVETHLEPPWTGADGP